MNVEKSKEGLQLVILIVFLLMITIVNRVSIEKIKTEYIMTENKEKIGWECPRCFKIHAPSEKQCSCIKKENNEDSKMVDINEG